MLPKLSVGALAAHLGRALLTVDAYLQGDVPPSNATHVDAAGYFVMVVGDHDPVASDFHQGVRQRGESAAEAGQPAVLDGLRSVFERLSQMPDDMDRRIAVLSGIQGIG